MKKRTAFVLLLLLAFLMAGSLPVPAASDKPVSSDSGTLPEPFNRVLQQGARGEDVKKLQEKLIELGFLKDRADGSFGAKTAAAVKDFNEANDLHKDAIADAATLNCLFDSPADTPAEPLIPVDLPSTEWRGISEEGASYRVQVANLSETKTIREIELQYYPSDLWGEDLWDYPYQKIAFNLTLAPGETGFTDWFYISPSWHRIDAINWGISRIVFGDGTVCDNDELTYWTVYLH